LYWSQEGLEQRVTELDKEDVQQAEVQKSLSEIKAGLQFVAEEFKDMSESLKTLIPEQLITFQYLWSILPPNTLVYAKDIFEQDRVFRTRSHRVEKQEDGSVVLLLSVEHTDSSGTKLGVVRSNLTIPQFDGAVSITGLPVYPLAFHPDTATLKQELLARGREQLKFHASGHHLMAYEGFAVKQVEKCLAKYKV
jgi:hypothetical protein